MIIDCPSLRNIKKAMQVTLSDSKFDDCGYQDSYEIKVYTNVNFVAFVAFVALVTNSNYNLVHELNPNDEREFDFENIHVANDALYEESKKNV